MGRVKPAGLEFLVKRFHQLWDGEDRGRDGEEGVVDFIRVPGSLSVCN
jgi:hypothetical protein